MKLSATDQQHLAAQLADAFCEAELKSGGITEAKKCFEYLRAIRNRESLFDLIKQRKQWKQPFNQNKNTPRHYEVIHNVLSDFLEANLDMSEEDFLHVFGWSVRLAQYRDKTQSGRLTIDAPKQKRTRPAAPQLPALGAVFTGSVIEIDEVAVLVQVPGFVTDKVLGVLRTERLEGKRFNVGNTARVEVLAIGTGKGGRQTLELKPAPKKQ